MRFGVRPKHQRFRSRRPYAASFSSIKRRLTFRPCSTMSSIDPTSPPRTARAIVCTSSMKRGSLSSNAKNQPRALSRWTGRVRGQSTKSPALRGSTPPATHEARTPRIVRRHCHDTVPSLAGLLFGGTVRRAAKQARKGLTQMQADARGCTLMGRSPAWSFTATIARPFLMSLAAAPVRVPSACISGHPPASALNPFLLALPRAAPRREGPRAPRGSQNPMHQFGAAPVGADRYHRGQDPLHLNRRAQPATDRADCCQGCQDPMHQSCAGIGCVPMAWVTVSGVAKRDACETASRAVNPAYPIGVAIQPMEPASALVSRNVPPSHDKRNETCARRGWARAAARRPSGHARLIRRVRRWRADPITLTLAGSRLDPRVKRPGACLSRSRGRG